MDLSKAFDCIPHDLLIAKMHVHGFSIDLLKFFSYLKGRKRNDNKIETIKLKRIQYKSDKC